MTDQNPAGAQEQLITGIGKLAQTMGIYNGEVGLSGPMALQLLQDMERSLQRKTTEGPDVASETRTGDLVTPDVAQVFYEASLHGAGPHTSWSTLSQEERDQHQKAAKKFLAWTAPYIHPISGNTADELWREAGRLRSQVADMKVTIRGLLEIMHQTAQPLANNEHARREFNRAIEFAISEGIGAADFLRAWREGDTSEWPEFAANFEQDLPAPQGG